MEKYKMNGNYIKIIFFMVYVLILFLYFSKKKYIKDKV